MRFHSILFSFLVLAFSVNGTVLDTLPDDSASVLCGTEFSDAEIIQAESKFESLKSSNNINDITNRANDVTFNVYWHVVAESRTVRGGWISDSMIRDEIEEMNQNYKPVGVSWRLVKITRTVNRDWFAKALPGSPQEASMKKTLKKGGANDLNIYSVSLSGTSITGSTGNLPGNYADAPWKDGFLIRYSVLAGSAGYRKTGSHEAGHWLGLLHTFQGGCSGAGDYVNDTPPEATSSPDCAAPRDTCPGGGPDPIHNFMDYGSGNCRTQFTRGQIERMHAQMRAFRIGK